MGGSIIVLGASAHISYNIICNTSLNLDKEAYLYIDRNDNIDSVQQKIIENIQPKSMFGFELLRKVYKYDERIKTGRYEIKPDDTMKSLFRTLYSGRQTPIKMTVPSVRTIDRMAQTLVQQLMLDRLEIMNMLTSSATITRFSYTPTPLPYPVIPTTS